MRKDKDSWKRINKGGEWMQGGKYIRKERVRHKDKLEGERKSVYAWKGKIGAGQEGLWQVRKGRGKEKMKRR